MRKILFSLLILIIANAVSANTITVSSLEELQLAITQAKAGDKILVNDGVYTAISDIIINRAGTRKHPIIISARHFGAAEITGNGGFNLASPAAYVVIQNFKFTHRASKAKSSSGSTFCRWTNNIFENRAMEKT